MNGKSMFILALAVAFGLGAMIVTRQMLSSGRRHRQEETQDVLVAARDLKEEEILKPDMVKVIRMAKSAVPAGAFSAFKDVKTAGSRRAARRRRGDREEAGPQGNAAGSGRQHSQGDAGLRHRRHRAIGRLGVHPARPSRRRDPVRATKERAHEPRRSCKTSWCWRPARCSPARGALGPIAHGDAGPEAREVDILVVARAKGSLSLALRGVNDHDVVVRPRPKPAIDPEHEKRLKLEEEKRLKLEEELRQLKETLAKKAAEPPRSAPQQAAAKVATVYRGIQKHRDHRYRIGPAAHGARADPIPRRRLPRRNGPAAPQVASSATRVASAGESASSPEPTSNRRPRHRDDRAGDRGIASSPCDSASAYARSIDSIAWIQPESNTMKDVIRIVLVDPNEESRASIAAAAGRNHDPLGRRRLDQLSGGRGPRRRNRRAPDHRRPRPRPQSGRRSDSETRSRPTRGAIVLPASRSCDSGLILRAIRAGHASSSPCPPSRPSCSRSITRLAPRPRTSRRRPARTAPRIITVTGAAGGVGCTTLAVNLAATLAAAKEQETILLDFDLVFGSVDACLDIVPDHTLSHVLQNFERLDLTLLKRSMTAPRFGPVRPAPPRGDRRRRQDRSRDACGGSSGCSRPRSARS